MHFEQRYCLNCPTLRMSNPPPQPFSWEFFPTFTPCPSFDRTSKFVCCADLFWRLQQKKTYLPRARTMQPLISLCVDPLFSLDSHRSIFAFARARHTSSALYPQEKMFARSIVRRRTYAEVMEKTAKYTVGSAGGSSPSIAMYVGIIVFPCVAFAMNGAFPSTRRVTDSHGFGGVDHPKNKNAIWQGK